MVSSSEEYLRAHPEIGSIKSLSPALYSGLIAVSIFALVSFILTSSLFLYLTGKLLAWHFRKRSRAHDITNNIPTPQPVTDFTFEEGAYGPQGETNRVAHDHSVKRIKNARDRPPNQFLILIFNLILADMHQGAAFLLSISWIQKGGIFVDSPTCFVQGFFDSNGDLSSSLFMTLIAIHTYLSVVLNYRPPQHVLYLLIIGIWVFVYSLSVIPLLVTGNGKDAGGFFVRAGPWCWINDAYENLRLLTHYLFIFLSLITTSTLYITIYVSLHRQARHKMKKLGNTDSRVKLNHNPAFLLYPLIYVLCTLPLALGRIATMAGVRVPMEYYCFAGSLIASNGSFDCLLFGTTRHAIVFSSTDDVDAESTGIETFAFTRTPAGRYGNVVWIEGGESRTRASGVGGWFQVLGRWGNSEIRLPPPRTRSISQESLRSNEMAIQMDVVTSIAVERNSRFYEMSRSETVSINPVDKDSNKAVLNIVL